MMMRLKGRSRENERMSPSISSMRCRVVSGSLATFSRAVESIARELSTPTTGTPAWAIGIRTRPVPQARSRTRDPVCRASCT